MPIPGILSTQILAIIIDLVQWSWLFCYLTPVLSEDFQDNNSGKLYLWDAKNVKETHSEFLFSHRILKER